jgi:hypothetical protein
VPVRRCLGCGVRAPKELLARFTVVPGQDGARLARDDRGRLGGRGLYVCRVPECFDRASARRAFQRGARLRGASLAVDPALGQALDEER